MKKLIGILFVLLAVAFAPVLALEPVWKHGTEEVVLSGSFVKNQATDHTDADLTGSWLHYATDSNQVGVVASLTRREGGGGEGIGPAYIFNFPKLRKGNFFLGGSAEALTGEISDLAKVRAASEFGYRLYVGDSSAFRVSMRLVKAINAESGDASDQIENIGLVLGFSTGINQGAAIQ